MKKRLTGWRIIALFLGVFLIMPSVFYHAIHWAESRCAHSLLMVENMLLVDQPLGRHLYSVSQPDCVQPDRCSFDVSVTGTQIASLQISSLFFPHRISVDGQIITQNIDPTEPYFDSAMRFKTVSFNERAEPYLLSIEGSGAAKTRIYLAEEKRMRIFQQIRSDLNACFGVTFFFTALLCIIREIAKHEMETGEIAVLIVSISALVKATISGGTSLIYGLPDLTPETFQVLDQLTSLLAILFLAVTFIKLLNVEPRRIIWGLLILFTLSWIAYMGTSGLYIDRVTLLLLLMTRLLFYGYLFGYAVLKQRPFAWTALWLHALAAGFLIYYAKQETHIETTGNLGFFFQTSFLAFVVQFFFASIALLHTSFKNAHQYERLQSLRGIEHDLKIPLSIVKLNHQMIRKYSLTDPKGIEYSDTAATAIDEIEAMLQNISIQFNFSKHTHPEETKISELLKNVETSFLATCIEKGAVLSTTLPEPDCIIPVSAQNLKRILLNLIDNALKHGDESIEVHLSAHSKGGRVEISVSDNGPGMSHLEARQATRMFYKADVSRQSPGLGIGLYIVNNLVLKHGGTLNIQSQKECGTTITLSFPCIRQMESIDQAP